jgi:hypothetical protein
MALAIDSKIVLINNLHSKYLITSSEVPAKPISRLELDSNHSLL